MVATAVRSGNTGAPNEELVDALYLKWLQGSSLRKLSASLSGKYSYSALHSRFKARYGELATNPVAMSLARSILEDYQGRNLVPDSELLTLALSLVETPETIKHRSEHSLDMLGAYQVVRKPQLLDFIASSEDPAMALEDSEDRDTWDFLRLELTLGVLRAIAETLKALLTSEAN